MVKSIKLILFSILFFTLDGVVIWQCMKAPKTVVKEEENNEFPDLVIVDDYVVVPEEMEEVVARDYSDYIQYMVKLSDNLNRKGLSFDEIELYDHEIHHKSNSDPDFSQFLRSNEQCIWIQKKSYSPRFIAEKLSAYYLTSQWIQSAEYAKIKAENARDPMEVYGTLNSYHVKCLHRISRCSYDKDGSVHKYNTQDMYVAKEKFKELAQNGELRSFRDLEKINVLEQK